jgi:Calcineurin-like phosphoesterase
MAMPSAMHTPDPKSDPTKAGTDGPHVFYKGGNIVVKSIVMEDTIAVARKQIFKQKSDVLLTCVVPETGDAFSFALMDSIRIPPTTYTEMPAKMLVLSDIEGNFKGFKMILLGAKVMDDKFNWTFGKGHLVLVGDYFDRGTNVTECLWLVYKLEKEAAEAGGKVHFIMGNHEVMNLSGDIRYVRNKYFENAELINEEYTSWYSINTELGQWLRSKNAVEQIGDYLFCHGGYSSTLLDTKLTLEAINDLARRHYGIPESAIKSNSAQIIFNSNYGIFWYRDMAKNKLEKMQVDNILDALKVRRIIIGHTLQSDLTALYGGSVICIDLYHDDNIRQGFMKTLYIENGLLFGLDSRNEKTSLFTAARHAKQKNE